LAKSRRLDVIARKPRRINVRDDEAPIGRIATLLSVAGNDKGDSKSKKLSATMVGTFNLSFFRNSTLSFHLH